MDKEQEQLVTSLMGKEYSIYLAMNNGNLIRVSKSRKPGLVLEEYTSGSIKLSSIPHNWVYLSTAPEIYHRVFDINGSSRIIFRELALSTSPLPLCLIEIASVKVGDMVYIKEVPLTEIEPDVVLPTFSKSTYHYLKNGLFQVVYKGVKRDIPEVYKSKTTQILVNNDITDYEYVIVVSIGPVDYILALEHIHKHGFFPVKTI